MATKRVKAKTQDDWADYDEATGFENTRSEDLGIPFIQIIQKGSPEFDETHKDHAKKKIDGIRPGDIIHSITREVLTKGRQKCFFIPCSAQKLYPEFVDRKTGGGFVKQHNRGVLNRVKRNDKNRDILQDEPGKGNEIVTTHYFFGFVWSEYMQEYSKAVVSMTSTQLKNGRRWLNLMSSQRVNSRPLPMFAYRYALNTTIETNTEGSWFGWDIQLDEPMRPTDGIIEKCKQVALEQRNEGFILEESSDS